MTSSLAVLSQGVGRRTLTRADVCGVNLTFQGLMVNTWQFGLQPWFEPAYQCLVDPVDRASVRGQKRAAGDTHLILEFFTNQESIYNEPGQPWQNAISPSGEAHPEWFRGLVEEVLDDGLVPIVVFDGDDGDNPMGYPNALRQLPILVDLLGDLWASILFARFWDGVFYGSSPAHIANFGTQFRTLLPKGYLAIEHQPGRIPVGNDLSDFVANGPMTTYDVICSEFQDRALDQDSTWQVGARLLGAAWHRPAIQPPGDDPNPPFILAHDSPRGPYFAVAFEYYAFEWVRGWVDAATVQSNRDKLRSLGWTYVS